MAGIHVVFELFKESVRAGLPGFSSGGFLLKSVEKLGLRKSGSDRCVGRLVEACQIRIRIRLAAIELQ